VPIGILYHIAAKRTIGSESTFSKKNVFVVLYLYLHCIAKIFSFNFYSYWLLFRVTRRESAAHVHL